MTISLLLVSRETGHLAERHSLRGLIRVGYVVILAGLVLMLFTVRASASGWSFIPSLLVIGLGIGIGTPAVTNLVMSAASASERSDVSGVSRSVLNLGMSLGTAVAGAMLIAGLIASMSGAVSKSAVLPDPIKTQIGKSLEGNIKTMSNTDLDKLLKKTRLDPKAVAEIKRVYGDARDDGLRLALLTIGILSLLGLVATFIIPKPLQPGKEESAVRETLDQAPEISD
jgi:MFS family permease